MTKQEIFDKAWNGLKSQGFERAHDGVGCVYYMQRDDKVLRCAWGWVDPEATQAGGCGGSVFTLRDRGIGLAATPEFEVESTYVATPGSLMHLAEELQIAHDGHEARVPEVMQQNLRAVAARFGLTVPE